ncbi:hypothetical protein AB0I34_14350 [Kribbella sp. NPDC050281]|uniref:hypothetical protein n=1 Tax=Kribbella sp. NPDC050281 TaxID=3155515 RepID=UPI0033D28070
MDFRVDVLLSFQRALWDEVTGNLRGVAVRPTSPVIEARFLYDTLPGGVEDEIVSEVETYVVADFNAPIDVRFRAVYSPRATARTLEAGEEWVYLRREPAATGRE